MSATPDRTASDPGLADRLRALVDGPVIAAGDAGYEEARPVWNARIDAHPALIVRPATAAGVAEAVRFGVGEGLTIAIRGGGHEIAGHGTVDDGLVIDLVDLDGIEVDAGRRIVRAEGGVRWGQLDPATAAHGLATVGGQISTTGVGGLTLGGGVGWLMGRHGLVIDNLLSVELVDATGRIRTVSAESEPDLFWALRGGGGNFGVATRFEFDLHPLSPVLAGTLLHPFDRAPEIIRRFRDASAEAPDELTLMVLLLKAPRQPFIPPDHQGRPVALFGVCWAGDPEAGREVLHPILEYGPPLVDSVAVRPYVELQAMFDVGSRAGFCNDWRSPFLGSLDDGAIDVIVDGAARMPTDISQVLLTNMGGAVARVPVEATAFPHRLAPFYLEVIAKWEAGADPGPPRDWAEAFAGAIEPWSTGYTYVNFLDAAGPDAIRKAYDPATLERLSAVKRQVDPDNVFRVNHNVVPAG